MIPRLSHFLAALPLVASLAGCGGAPMPRAEAMAAAQGPAPAAPLSRSFFSRDGTGSIGEDDLQHVLASPIDLQFPARIGVVPLAHPFNAQGQASITTRSTASRDLATSLMGTPHFSHVSDVSTDLPNAGGIEGLRALAARYRMRYLLLYSEHFEDTTHLNGLAWLYPTVVGMFVLPAVTVQSQGLAQADLLDVRTGTVLFSVVEPINVSSMQMMIGAGRSHRALQARAASEAARRLAKRVAGQTDQILAYADEMTHERARAQIRILPAPVAVENTPAAPQPVARP